MFPAEEGSFSLRQRVKVYFGKQPASYQTGIGVKLPERQDNSAPPSAEDRNAPVLPLPGTSQLCDILSTKVTLF